MPTANDRFKATFSRTYWYSVTLAVVLHFALLQFTPAFAAERFDRPDAEPIVVYAERVELPPPPNAIPRPALPIIAEGEIDAALTIPTIPFERYAPPPPPPPPSVGGRSDGVREQFEAFVPSMTAPRLLNAAEIERALQQQYPALLRDAGIEGSVEVELWLTEKGEVARAGIARSSGYGAMDAAALAVVDRMRLTPALNRGRAVRVIVNVPVRFRVR